MAAELQRMLTRHRAELASAEQRAADQTRAAVEAARIQHEAALAAMRERLGAVRTCSSLIYC